MQPVLADVHRFRPETFGASRGLLAERLKENNPDGFCFVSGLGTFVPPGSSERQRAAELEAVLVSLENLPTFPCVRERLDRGALHLHGWFFKTATGEFFAFNPAAGQFERLMTFEEARRA